MTPKLRLTLKLADELMEFDLGNCGPSDDPDKQTAYLAAFNDIAVRFIAAGRRIGDPEFTEMLEDAAQQPDQIVEAYTQRAKLLAAIDYLKEAAEQASYEDDLVLNSAFVAPEVLHALRAATPAKYDFKKLIAFCDELNDAYRRRRLPLDGVTYPSRYEPCAAGFRPDVIRSGGGAFRTQHKAHARKIRK
jgi:hypothetical protein